MPWVYLLRCGDGTLYAGATKDLGRRLEQHRRGTASRYTRSRLPVELAWSRRVRSWSRALGEEHRLKRLRRAAKEELVRAAGGVPPRQVRGHQAKGLTTRTPR